MIKREEAYKIGIFNKPHGIHGELQFTFTDDIFDRVEADYVICLLDGIFVPFFIEEYRFRSDTTALMKLEGVDTTERARMFTNVEVYFPRQEVEEESRDGLTWDYFVGFDVFDLHNRYLGTVTDIDTSTLNTLLVIEKEGMEQLIPAQEAFVTDIDENSRKLVMDLPVGLLSLEDAEEV